MEYMQQLGNKVCMVKEDPLSLSSQPKKKETCKKVKNDLSIRAYMNLIFRKMRLKNKGFHGPPISINQHFVAGSYTSFKPHNHRVETKFIL